MGKINPQKYQIRNWRSYQHYMDRSPPWIKLHADLLNSRDWVVASNETRVLLISCMILASKDDGRVPNDPDYLRRAAYLDHQPDLTPLISSGFLEKAGPPAQRWSRRHIPQDVRDAVMARDKWKCTKCGSTKGLEIDHVLPVSRGGDGNISNLRLLCRKCNRKKGVSLADATLSGQVKSAVLPESEKESEIEKKEVIYTSAKKPKTSMPEIWPTDIDRQWALNHWREKGREDLCGDVDEHMAEARHHHSENETRSGDWPGSWRTWAQRAVRYNRRAHNGQSKPRATDNHLAGIASLIADGRARRQQ